VEVLPVRSDNQDAAKTTAAQLFHVTAEGVQNLAQWFASRRHLKQLHFSGKQSLRPFQIVDVNLARYIEDDVAVCITDGDASCARPPIGAIRV
jgi:hypothetical protein